MKNPFKPGDKVICISKPQTGHYQCEVGVKAIVKGINLGNNIITEEDICTSNPGDPWACYGHRHFKLQKKSISFKTLKEI